MGSQKLQVLPWEKVLFLASKALTLICGTLGNAKGLEGASYLLRTRQPQLHPALSAYLWLLGLGLCVDEKARSQGWAASVVASGRTVSSTADMG